MGLTADPNLERELARAIEREIERLNKGILRALQYAGERAVEALRSLPSPSAADFPGYPDIPPHQPNFIDWTANLRNSIGYVVVMEGRVVGEGGFDSGRDAPEGEKAGRSFARSLASKFPAGMALVLVAGMDYASYVAAKGYDVLDSGELEAERLLPRLLAGLGLRFQ